MRLRLARLAQDAQDDRGAVAQRIERPGPGGELAGALLRGPVQPVVVGGQVELAGAAGDAGALLDRHQPVVLAQVLADLAGHREQRLRRLLDVAQHAGRARPRRCRGCCGTTAAPASAARAPAAGRTSGRRGPATSRISNSVSSAMWWSCGSVRAMKWRERSNRSSSRSSVRMRSLSGIFVGDHGFAERIVGIFAMQSVGRPVCAMRRRVQPPLSITSSAAASRARRAAPGCAMMRAHLVLRQAAARAHPRDLRLLRARRPPARGRPGAR